MRAPKVLDLCDSSGNSARASDEDLGGILIVSTLFGFDSVVESRFASRASPSCPFLLTATKLERIFDSGLGESEPTKMGNSKCLKSAW